MIDLAQRSEPYEIAVPYGLSVMVKPLTTAGIAAAQAAARRAVEAIERQFVERRDADLAPDGLPNLSAEGRARRLLPGAADPRLTPRGHVIGIDTNAALMLASARSHDLAVLSELLPAAEGGLVEASSLETAQLRSGDGRHQSTQT